MKSLFLILLFSIGVYASWDDYIIPVITKHFPREMIVTNKDGDMLEITLIRRDEKNAYFHREGDQILHRYEIAQLNFLSRCKVKLYPRTSPKSTRTKDKKEDDPAQMHLNSMYEEHKERLEQLRLLKIKLGSASSINTRQAINHEIISLSNKINALIYRIEEFKYRYPRLISGAKTLDMIKVKTKETKEYESADKAFDLLQKFGN